MYRLEYSTYNIILFRLVNFKQNTVGPFNYYVTLPGGGGGRPSVTLCDRGRWGSAERYVTPKIFYMYDIIL